MAVRFLASVLFVVLFSGSACKHGNVKVYQVNEDKGGLVRKQADEVLTWVQGHGFLCQSPQDFEATWECLQGVKKKVYFLDSVRGLVRKQAGEIIIFRDAKGYFCVSKTDFEKIVNDCIEESKNNP